MRHGNPTRFATDYLCDTAVVYDTAVLEVLGLNTGSDDIFV